jgi:hypothetical protein
VEQVKNDESFENLVGLPIIGVLSSFSENTVRTANKIGIERYENI